MRLKILLIIAAIVCLTAATGFAQTPKPTVSPAPSVSPKPSPSPSPSPSISPKPTVTPSPSVSPKPVVTPSPSVSPAPLITPKVTTDNASLVSKETKDQKLNKFRPVNGRENWDYTYDVSDLDKGLYNIVVQATDKAGNVYTSVPVNITIDPESDLPVASFTNPVEGMRVGGSVLNIVGTCTDDDAVAKVQVAIDQGDFKDAEGQDFWSYKLSTQGLEDGRHEITVQGVDINGVIGHKISRSFNLDTHKPLTQITSASSGVLLSGARDLEGTVQDLNDIASFSYSDDNGKTFKPLGLSYKAEEKKYYFKLRVDTTRLPDGPQVYWFKGVDKQGSEGLAAFLFFAANTKPSLSIISPKKDAKENGKFYVIGRVQSQVGIESLTWQYRDKTGDLKLIPGNPYWYLEVDTTPYATTAETVTFTVKDIVGNVLQMPCKIDIDQNADKPVAEITAPADKSQTGSELDVYGFVSDDDEPAAISYSLDGKEAVSVPAKDAFAFRLTRLEPGKHTLAVWGTDVNKVPGDKKTVEFTVLGAAAAIRIQSVVVQGTTARFYPGAEIGRYDKAALRGTITEYERFKKVFYSIDNGEQKDLALRPAADKYLREFDIPLPDTIPFGLVEIKISAVDIFDRTTDFLTVVHVTNYGKIFGKAGFYQADARLDTGSIPVSAEHPYECFFFGDKVKSIDLDPKLTSVNAHVVNGRVSVIPLSQVKGETARIKIITENNETFVTEPLTFSEAQDYYAEPLHIVKLAFATTPAGRVEFYPGLALASPDGQSKIEGTCSSEAARVEVSFDNKTFRPAEYRRAKDQPLSDFSFTLPRELAFGYNEIQIRLTNDKQSQAGFKSFFFKIDTTGKTNPDEPGLFFKDARLGADNEIHLAKDAPLSGFVNGREIKSVTLKPTTDLVKAGFTGNFITVEATGEGKSAPTKIEVVTANNLTFSSQAVVFNTDGQPPVVKVTTPVVGDWVTKTINLTGTVSDGTGVQSLEYKFNSQDVWVKMSLKSSTPDKTKPAPTTPAKGESFFSQTIDISSLADGNLTLFVRASDLAGNQIVQPLSLKKDTQAPAAEIVTPEAGAKVNGLFTVTGVTADAGRVAKIEFSPDGKTWVPVIGLRQFAYNLDLTQFAKPPEKYYLKITDAALNTAVFNPQFPIDFEIDKPRAEIQVPTRAEVLRNDFVISGMAFDDDGIKSISYRLDGKEWVKLGGGSSFSIPVALVNITDNEHKIEVQAEDLNGLKGDIAASTFYVSKEEPISILVSPTINQTARGKTVLQGTGNDANGIRSVALSFDSGNTWLEAQGKEKWSYAFDTALLADGVHRLLIRAVDTTGTEGLSATLLHVDNTAPALSLDRPVEGETVSDMLVLDGRSSDNIELARLTANVAPVNQEKPDSAGKEYDLTAGGVFLKSIDMSKMKEGWYNIRIEARDKADNVTIVTRNIRIEQKKNTNRVDVIFPQDGDSVAGQFNLNGRIVSELAIRSASLSVDGKDPLPLEITADGFYQIALGPQQLAAGDHIMVVSAALADGSVLPSEKTRLRYQAKGPWVTFTGLNTGDFVAKRPWIKGQAGYWLPPVGREEKEAFAAYEKELQANRIDKVEISFDNGKTFQSTGGGAAWSYRLQTQDIPDGPVRLMLRATTSSGQTAIAKAIVTNDDRPPTVRILLPEEGQKFNDKIAVLGIAADENGLTDIRINLRPGDKASYKIPEFIQGMYIDMFGRYRFDMPEISPSWYAGFGLTFFDQNVKLQAHIGYEPSARFGGSYLGLKLLANIFKLPAEWIFGPDLDFLSASLAIGASFSYCSDTAGVFTFSDQGVVVSAVLTQLEIKLANNAWSVFNAYSFITEFGVWFFSTDVPGVPVVEARLMFGLRVGLF